jgi:hypothetical protein
MANFGEAPVMEVVKISGNDQVREGVEAFVFINLARWNVSQARIVRQPRL